METSKYYEILKIISDKKLYRVIYQDGEFTCTGDDIVNYRIIKGKIYSSEELNQIINATKLSKYYLDAINYASYRIRSQKEFILYLEKKALNHYEINQILDKLKNNNYIDDYRFGCIMTKKYYNSGKGLRYIKIYLMNKGLNEDLITKIFNDLNLDESNILNIIIDQLLLKYHSYPVTIQKQKIYQKLIRDGYNSELITKLLNDKNINSDTKDRLKKDIVKYQNKDLDNYTIRYKLLNKGYSRRDIDELL